MRTLFAPVLAAMFAANPFHLSAEAANELRVPAGTTVSIATADDVAKFAALDAIVFEEGDEPGRIDYTAAEPLVLKAALSGPGVFAATGAGQLTLLSDNSGLVAPGHFAFTNTPVTVAHEYGLGDKGTAEAFVHIDNASGKTAEAIANRTNYSLIFQTENNVLTNHVDIAFDTPMNFGAETDAETLVMDASLLWRKDANLDALYCKGHVEFISGRWSSNWKSWKHGYTEKASGYVGQPTVRFSGDSYLETSYFFGSGVTWYFDSTTTKHRISNYTSTGTYVGCFENALPKTDVFPYATQVIDLGGFDQELTGFNYKQYGSTCYAKGSTSYSTVRSATPARLVLKTNHTAANYASYTNWGVKVTGQAGILKDTTDPIVMWNHVSDTKGTLEIAKGSLAFVENAGWSDGTIKVSGGTLLALSASTMASAKTALVVEGTGKVLVGDGVDLMASRAEIGGQTLEEGTYTLDDLAEMGLSDYIAAADGATGNGTLVIGGDLEWHGWPEEPGAGVKIPPNAAVVVTDEDIARVTACASIFLKPQSTLVFSNQTERLLLDLPLASDGSASIRAADGAYVVLAADNSGILGKTFVEAGSTVIVSNRYGLGTSETMSASVAADGNLWFGGNGLTNDVALSTSGDRQFQVDPENDGVFVQNGTLHVGNGPTVTFGDAEFNGLYQNGGGSMTTVVKPGHRLTFNHSVYCVGYFMTGTGEYLFNATGNSWGRLYNYSENSTFVCGAEDVLTVSGGTASGFLHVNPIDAPEGVLDLNGYDQKIPYVFCAADPVAGEKNYYPIRSDAPATLTFCEAASNDRVGALKFSGQAGFRYESAGKYTLRNIVSDSTADLTVAAGTLELADGAGWTGDINVTGGKLILSSFYSAGKDTTITVSGDGELNIPEGCRIPARRLVAGGRTIDVTGRYPVSELQIPGVTGGGEFWVGNELYVSPTGSDANDGFTRETPKKTLQTVLDEMCVEGTTVYLLPGVYSNGATRVGSAKTLNRVVVPKGVELVGLGDKSEVVVMGEAAPLEKQVANTHGCGEDAVRCLYLKGNATIRNLTLTQGRVFTDGYQNASKNNEYHAAAASAVTDSSNTFIDCIISNNYANIGAGLTYATLIRCRICYNVAAWYSPGAENSSLYNCIVDHNTGAYPVHHCVRVVNCTLGPGNSQDDCRYSGTAGRFYNTLMMSYINVGNPPSPVDFYRTYCNYANQGFLEQGVPAERLHDGCKDKMDGIQVVLGGDFRAAVDSCLVDAGNDDYLSILPANYADEAMKSDFYGNPRALGASVDIGAVEYDWRGEFTQDLGRKVVVTDASVGVVETEAKTVSIPDGGEIVVGWKDKAKAPKDRIFRFNVADGTLTVKVNGETVAAFTANGEWTYRSGAATDTITFSFAASEEGGSAELLRSTADIGALLIVR